METTQTSLLITRTEIIEMLTNLNVTTTLVRLAETREDGKGVCGAFTVVHQNGDYILQIDLAWASN